MAKKKSKLLLACFLAYAPWLPVTFEKWQTKRGGIQKHFGQHVSFCVRLSLAMFYAQYSLGGLYLKRDTDV